MNTDQQEYQRLITQKRELELEIKKVLKEKKQSVKENSEVFDSAMGAASKLQQVQAICSAENIILTWES